MVFENVFNRDISGNDFHDVVSLPKSNHIIKVIASNSNRNQKKPAKNLRAILIDRNFKNLVLNIFCSCYGKLDVKIKIMP